MIVKKRIDRKIWFLGQPGNGVYIPSFSAILCKSLFLNHLIDSEEK
ncbi:MAG: hypothetical protein ACRC10_12335 [Thermoguttaceae bacterium]